MSVCKIFFALQLFAEMDRILGVGTCQKFRQSWLDIVPLIIASAKTKKVQAITKLLGAQRFQELAADFGN